MRLLRNYLRNAFWSGMLCNNYVQVFAKFFTKQTSSYKCWLSTRAEDCLWRYAKPFQGLMVLS